MRKHLVVVLAVGTFVAIVVVGVLSVIGIRWQVGADQSGIVELKDGDLYEVGVKGGALYWLRSETRQVPIGSLLSSFSAPRHHWILPTCYFAGGAAFHTGPISEPMQVQGTQVWHVPIWPELVLSSILCMYIVWRSRRGRRALRRGDCLACGYSLTGNTSGVCPECGVQVKPGDGREAGG